MADRDDTPRGHVIEPARTGRSKCQSCGRAIGDGELRLSEAYVSDEGRWARSHQSARSPRSHDPLGEGDRRYGNDTTNPDVWARFHHLACAAQHQPYKLQSALAATALAIPEREELERGIQRALSAVDAAEDDAATREEHAQFIARLREAPPGDDDLVLVFGDWLQSVGDPRGELIAVQHALETAAGDDKVALATTEKKLLAVHSRHLTPDRIDGTLAWRRGFVHRVVLASVETVALARTFAHPSLRLVREVVTACSGWSSIVVAANLPTPLPATLRILELAHTGCLGVIAPLLADSLPVLERLKLDGAADLDGLRHPTLAELELVATAATTAGPATPRGEPRSLLDRIAQLNRRSLPGLARLILRVDSGLEAAVAALAETNLLAGLHTLALHGDLGLAGLARLRDLGVRFEVLDLRKTRLARADLAALAPLAATVIVEELVAPVAPVAAAPIREWLVRHTRKPEWGTGRVVEETDGGLQVEFEHGGAKLVRNVELLEEIEP